jgi:hypothetical protein
MTATLTEPSLNGAARFSDPGLVKVVIESLAGEAECRLPVYEIEAELIELYREFDRLNAERGEGKELTTVEAKPRYRKVFDPYGVPELSAGGYKSLAAWVHGRVGEVQKKSLSYANAELPSSTDSGRGD